MAKISDWQIVVVVFAVFAAAAAVEHWATAIPAKPADQQAESVADDSGFGARSGKWPAVRAAFVKLNPRCAACGSANDLHVHHVKPVHTHPELELEPPNLIPLCAKHHWLVGHDPDGPRGPQKPDWKKSNPFVRRDARMLLESK